jgi:hypothetical protein
MLIGAVGARRPPRDLEVAVGNGRGEIHRQRHRLTQTVGMHLDSAQQGRGGDTAEGAHHVRPLRPSTTPDDIVVDDLESNRAVQSVRVGHRYDVS